MEKQPDDCPIRVHEVMLLVTTSSLLVLMAQGQGVSMPKSVSSTCSLLSVLSHFLYHFLPFFSHCWVHAKAQVGAITSSS